MVKKEKYNLKKYGRIIIFIDASNIIYSLKDLGWKISYKRLQEYFAKNSKLVDIYFYTAKEDGKDSQDGFLAMISRYGFKLRVRRLKVVGGHPKGNVDVDLSVDMIDQIPNYDTAILMSGDGDFQSLVNYVRSKGKVVVAVSTRGHIAKELVDAADEYWYLDNFREFWELK